jgi:hypothetical protein
MNQGCLSAFNQALDLPEQDPCEITFNSSSHLQRGLFPFKLPACPIYPGTAVPFERLTRPICEEALFQSTKLFPEDLNVVHTIINPRANTIWIRSFEPNRLGIGVFVERHIFFHTGTPFTSLDSVFTSQRIFKAIPLQQREGVSIGDGSVCFVNGNLINHHTR